jgi:integrase
VSRTGTRRTVERGIYKDAKGYEVVARAGKRSRSLRYPLDTALEDMRAWRDATATDLRSDAQPTSDTRTIIGAVAYYIRTTDPDEPSQLNAWAQAFGALERRKLTPAKAQQAFDRWANEGYSPQTLRVRRFALQKLWRALDGPKVKTPVDDVKLRKAKPERPVWVPDETILHVLMELRRHEMRGWIRSPKTRARFLVLATTGQRPAQLKLAQRGDVDLRARIWWVRPAKGGDRIAVYLNSEMLTAWEGFIRANAWGAYDTRSFARTLRSCGWPKGVRPYNVRHATGMTLSARGRDLGDIQTHLGHTSIATTRAFYVPGLDERSRAVAEALESRFDTRSVAPERGTRKNS